MAPGVRINAVAAVKGKGETEPVARIGEGGRRGATSPWVMLWLQGWTWAPGGGICMLLVLGRQAVEREREGQLALDFRGGKICTVLDIPPTLPPMPPPALSGRTELLAQKVAQSFPWRSPLC